MKVAKNEDTRMRIRHHGYSFTSFFTMDFNGQLDAATAKVTPHQKRHCTIDYL
jgi:hypothetical protein